MCVQSGVSRESVAEKTRIGVVVVVEEMAPYVEC